MEHEELTQQIIGCAYRVYNKLGFGFLESIYEKCLMIELQKKGIKAESQATGKDVGLLLNFGQRKVEVRRKVREFRER